MKSAAVHTSIDERPEGRLATVTVDYPERINILGSAAIAALREAFEALADDTELRAVVLTGAGDRAFIGGADINEMVELDAASAESFITALHEACQSIRDCPVPVIASIRGYCLGAGLEVAAACDLRIATRDARFGMPEVRVGVPSVIEAALLPPLIGWGKTRELLYTGAMIDAEQAARIGLVERVVAEDELAKGVEGWLDDIMSAGPAAIRAQKRLIREWERLTLDRSIEAGIGVFRAAFEGPEPVEMMRAFIERDR